MFFVEIFKILLWVGIIGVVERTCESIFKVVTGVRTILLVYRRCENIWKTQNMAANERPKKNGNVQAMFSVNFKAC